ncbi:MAG: family 43 glycosylhydrolase [Prolixibacteraceae bacterium]|jgi:beta-xylosidase|nr:family 43 glycosylhydrolase [Prolixibacteraceae bacterium]
MMKTSIQTLSLMMLIVLTTACTSSKTELKVKQPLFDGYYAADPVIVEHEGEYYIYATKDPWGGNDLAVFVTSDFVTWEEQQLNWPTKAACTSPTSRGANVWAPDVVKGNDGSFYMYVSVGSEIWAGSADHPLGPWSNMKSDNSPLIKGNAIGEHMHNIDANCFIDDDGSIYLYWGSGWNWVNGHCMAVELDSDMHTFLNEPKDITPPNFFEGAFMIKRNKQYYLMYSDGKAIDHTYKIRYSTSNSPYGPWTEGLYSPITKTTPDSTVYGPGHHSIFTNKEQDYILYHQIHPQDEEYVLRQLYIDSLNFDANGNILKVNYEGVYPLK